jgi:N-acetylglucosaminyl-diphospho-decaprenol L-rhamnosyltransferase
VKCLVVIVNYRTAGLTIDCLRSLADEVQRVPGCRVTVVDGASGDGSAEQLAAAIVANGWGEWIKLLPLEHNGGFASANNAALRQGLDDPAGAECFFLLNPDTIVHPGALTALLQFLKDHPAAGIVGSRLEHRDGAPQPSAFRFHSFLSELENGARLGLLSRLLRSRIVAQPPADEPIRTDWVSGAAMMIRREVLEKVGLLDDGYFMYYEEVDLCLRAQSAGFECWHVPQSRIIHLIGQASGVNDPARPKRRRPGYWFESRQRYFRKNHGRLYAALADAAWASGYITWRLRRIVQRKGDPDPPMLLRDFLRHSILLGGSVERGNVAAPASRATPVMSPAREAR